MIAAVGGTSVSQAGRVTGRIEVRSVTHRYGSRTETPLVLQDIDLSLEPGSFVAVVGPSGSGKTTLLHLLAGFIRPSSGAILVDGQAVAGPGRNRGVVFQQPNLFPWLSVRKNIELGPRMRGASRRERAAIASELLDLVGLSDDGDRPGYELSGGMQQRAAIARVLAGEPSIVLMDEPLGALDAITRERMQSELVAIWLRTARTFVLITHSVDEALLLGTRVLVLGGRPGRIVLDLDIGSDEPGAVRRSSTAYPALRDRVVRAIAEVVVET